MGADIGPPPLIGSESSIETDIRAMEEFAATLANEVQTGYDPHLQKVIPAMMTELLTMHGHTVTVASSVRRAIAAAQEGNFDLVVSDLGLPDGTGIDMLVALRAAGLTTRAIALSGYGMEADRKRTAEAGFAEHLVKPVPFRDLQAAILRVTSAPS